MENQEQANVPKKKKINDFVLLFMGIVGLIAALMLLKYLMSAFHLM